MPNRTSKTGSELFIVDNSDADWKVLRYLHDWCQISRAIDVATGYFEIGAFLGLKDEWQKVDQIRVLMGDEVSRRTRAAFAEGLAHVRGRLDSLPALLNGRPSANRLQPRYDSTGRRTSTLPRWRARRGRTDCLVP